MSITVSAPPSMCDRPDVPPTPDWIATMDVLIGPVGIGSQRQEADLLMIESGSPANFPATPIAGSAEHLIGIDADRPHRGRRPLTAQFVDLIADPCASRPARSSPGADHR